MLSVNLSDSIGARLLWIRSSKSSDTKRTTVCDFMSWMVMMLGSGLCPRAVASNVT